MKSYCSKCNLKSNQIVLHEEKTSYSYVDANGAPEWWEENQYQIIKCAGCDDISFRKLQMNAQLDYFDALPDQELYPKRGPKSRPIKSFHNLPLKVKGIYRETIDAYNNDQPILCSVGLRALIEGICLDKSVLGTQIVSKKTGKKILKKDLEGKITGLSERGFLTVDNANTLHELRFLGNEAVHELSKPSNEELVLALEIIEHTIEALYELQQKAINLKQKKTKRKN